MSYASVSEFKAGIPRRDLVQLTDLDDGTGGINDDRIDEALKDASAEIDSYIAKAVSLPLPEVPRMLKKICRALALHQLYVNIGHNMEGRKSLRDDAISYLKAVQKGDAALGDGGDVPPEVVSPGIAMTDGAEREVTRDSLKGY